MNCSLKRLNLIAPHLRGDCAGARLGRRSAEKIGFKPKNRSHSDHWYFNSTSRSIYAGKVPFLPSNSVFSRSLKLPTNLTGNVERPVTITGRLSKPVTSVTINQHQATPEQGGMAFCFLRFFVREGTNMITAVATDAQGRVVSSAIKAIIESGHNQSSASNVSSLYEEIDADAIHYYFSSTLCKFHDDETLVWPSKLASFVLSRIRAVFHKPSMPNSQLMLRMI